MVATTPATSSSANKTTKAKSKLTPPGTSTLAAPKSTKAAPAKKAPSRTKGKITGATTAPTSPSKATVDFRFQCDPALRDQLNERLKLLRIERSIVMESFIKEWLTQTDTFIQAPSQS